MLPVGHCGLFLHVLVVSPNDMVVTKHWGSLPHVKLDKLGSVCVLFEEMIEQIITNSTMQHQITNNSNNYGL